MGRACTAKCQPLAPLMRLTNLELRCEIQQIAKNDPIQAVHLCHELLHAQTHYPTRPALNMVVGSALQEIGKIIQYTPEA